MLVVERYDDGATFYTWMMAGAFRWIEVARSVTASSALGQKRDGVIVNLRHFFIETTVCDSQHCDTVGEFLVPESFPRDFRNPCYCDALTRIIRLDG